MKLYEKIFHHNISIEEKCPKCSGINFIYNVETLIKNKCRDCDSSLDLFKGKPDIDSIMEFCYHQGSPDVTLTPNYGTLTAILKTTLDNDIAKEQKDLQDELDDYKVYPVISFGVTYTF